MKIETELSIGDTIYVIKKEAIVLPNKCEFCEGTGKLTITGKNGEKTAIVCPKCNGKASPAEIKAVVKAYEIKRVSVLFCKLMVIVGYINDRQEEYTLDHNEYVDEKRFAFKTFEEAQTFADELNKKGFGEDWE